MKKIIIGAVVIVLGLFISLGPQFLLKVCSYTTVSTAGAGTGNMEGCGDTCGCGSTTTAYPICYWSARAEIGIGFLVIALGACLILFTDSKTQLGLFLGTFFSSLIALAIPYSLIGGCGTGMQCEKVAFPALAVESIILLVLSAIMVTIIAMQKKVSETSKKE